LRWWQWSFARRWWRARGQRELGERCAPLMLDAD
jgi:hypothetical protein